MAITLRRATRADIPRLAHLAGRAFGRDALHANLFPDRLRVRDLAADEADEDRWREMRYTARLGDGDGDGDGANSAKITMVAEQGGLIVGFAQWNGPEVQAADKAAEGARALADAVVDVGPAGAKKEAEDEEKEKKEKEKKEKEKGDNGPVPPSLDRDALAHVERSLEEAGRALFGERGAKDVWYLSSLAVDPAYARRGIGKTLLSSGMERAEREGKVCYLLSTPAGKPLYDAMGFETVGELQLWGTAFPLMVVKNGNTVG